jgi:hypothetical protein
VDIRVLAEVESGEVEPEGLDRADQPVEPTAGHGSAVLEQRGAHHREVGKESLRIGVGFRRHLRRTRWLSAGE